MNRATAEMAGAETIGALLLFGLFVVTIASLNVTAVPDAGLAAEQAHHARALNALADLQADAESIARTEGGTAAKSLPLAPEPVARQDFFSYFLARPARATGEASFVADHGNLTLSHVVTGVATPVYDIGGANARVPLGRLTFDPKPVFRNEGVLRLEGGAVLATDLAGEGVRASPPITVAVNGHVTDVSVLGRVLNGTDATHGGTGELRLRLTTQASTLSAPALPNAESVTLRLETTHGRAWGDHLNATARQAGLPAGTGYQTTVARGAAPGGLDVVTWTVFGLGTGNDVRLTSGLAVQKVTFG